MSSRPRLAPLAPVAGFLLLWLVLPAAAANDVPRGPSHEPVPYRYDPATWKAVPKAFLDDGPACVLYAGANYILEPDGTVEEVVHEVTRLNNRRGVELLGEFRSIAYDPSYQKATLNVARVHKADGRTLDVGSQYAHLRDSNTDYKIYYQYRQLIISFPDLAVGDVIEVKWSLRGKDPEGHGQFFNSYNFGNDDYPAVHDELRVMLLHGRTLRYSARGGKLEPTVYESEEARMYHWQVKIKPPLPADKDVPSKEELRLKVFLSTFATWDEVADWYHKVHHGCWECTPELGRIAREVTTGLDSDEDKARALTYWVRKNVRYLSRHERDSFAPLTPGRVLSARYGDCKDQSQMLAVLLRQAGVKAGVAIIAWADSGDILESFPSPWGNHAIVLATIDGREQWIDPVFSHAAWDVLPPEDHDRMCVVVDDTGPVRLVRTPKLKPEGNRTEQTTTAHIARDGSAHCEREIVYRGVAAAYQHDELLSLSEGGRKQHLLPELQQFHQRANITKVTVDPNGLDDLDAPVRVRVEFDVPKDFAESSVRLYDVQVFYNLLAHRGAPDRKVALAAGHPCELKQRFILELPPGYRFGEAASSTPAKSAWGKFTCTTKKSTSNPRRLEVVSDLVLEKNRVEVAELPAYAKFAKEVEDSYAVGLSRLEAADLTDAPLLEAELVKAPADVELALFVAKLYRSQGKPAEAARVLQTALDTAADDRVAQELLQVTDEQEKQANTARAKAHWRLASSDFGRNKFKEALEHLTQAAASDEAILLNTDAAST